MDSNYGSAIGTIGILIYLVIMVVWIVSFWKLFTKAGKPGWAAIIPIYNLIVMLDIIKRPLWWIILLLIPFVNIIFTIIVMADFVKAYGKPGWHAILAILFGIIYFPYLAFSDASYVL